MAITLTYPTLPSEGVYFSDESNEFIFESDEGHRDGFYFRVVIKNHVDVPMYVGTHYQDNSSAPRCVFDSYDVFSNLATVTYTFHPYSSLFSFKMEVTEKWVENGMIVTGATEVGSLELVLKGKRGAIPLRSLSNGSILLSDIPEGANYYNTSNDYLVAFNPNFELFQSVQKNNALFSSLNLQELQLDCGNPCVLRWKNSYGVNDCFVFSHNYELSRATTDFKWGFLNEIYVSKIGTRYIDIHSGYINNQTAQWLINDVMMSVALGVYLPNGAQIFVTLEDTSKNIQTTNYGELVNVSFKLRVVEQQVSLKS